MTISDLSAFVAPYYDKKDVLHNNEHTKRLIKMVDRIIEKGGYKNDIAYDNIICAAYLHVMVKTDEALALRWLKEQGIGSSHAEDIVEIAKRAQRDARPNTLESKILHDANILEGGKSYFAVRYIIYGNYNGISIKRMLDNIENTIIPSLRCYLPVTQEMFEESKAYALNFVEQLREDI